MAFAPKPGCPMCGIVASAADHAPGQSPRSPSGPDTPAQPEILWRDENFTAYREKVHPVSSNGHIIIAFNLHVPSIYTLSSSDLPLLVNVRNLGRRLLSVSSPPSSPLFSPANSSAPSAPLQHAESQFRIGFITPPFKDNKIPITDHLHTHAYLAPADLLGWWRGVAYGPLAWYAIDDLIAEIRESVSNNRVKSGHDNRINAPIDMVPEAGARTGAANGDEYTASSLAISDVEDGLASPSPSSNRISSASSSSGHLPHLHV
ncbi:hypothetical protein DEU56DRAFT_767394 [Suillus clintonianus]|uniref:uncharacterized protein n=1 Tax=Suillus clintonianus TaxID=1904413 RepID=UPI001B879A41|nr:uncharacterized protein DEU56DRAFT_767394 [Suillus clintonianus]KAG2155441.1 hypothetical protein DEU56DRAFT_767394 [Suillus clintonianus]